MRNILLCVTLMSICCVDQISGFIPNRLPSIVFGLDFTAATVDHTQITEDALLQVVRELLLDNPNNNSAVNSTSQINSIDSITAHKLIQAYYGVASVDLSGRLIDAIEVITESNSDVDLEVDEQKSAAAHFDSEQIQAGHNRVVQLKYIIINEIKLEKYNDARVQAGRMLHTVQDFYSHTNWVEAGLEIPTNFLGRMDRNPTNVAGLQSTCSDCVKGKKVNMSMSLPANAMYHYNCSSDNILPQVYSGVLLTSGYFGGQVNESGHEIEKRKGKCSHGGFLDVSSDIPGTGGINKDSAIQSWSPHASLHSKAVVLANLSSVSILNDIRSAVNDDRKFASFLNIALGKQNISSIAYVIDTTGSMSGEIPEIKATLSSIRMQIETYIQSLGPNVDVNLILVPFNDPDNGDIFTTTDIDEFLNAINGITANGGGDCPEPSIGATIRAIRASERGSPIYVFTDAGPSDVERKTEIMALIRDTGVTISYILTGMCSRRRRSVNVQFDKIGQDNQDVQHRLRNRRQSTEGSIYSNIAAFSGGQVLNVQTSSISELSSIIFLSSELTFTEIYGRTGTGTISSSHSFSVDNTISVLLITLNGYSISSIVRTPEGNEISSLDPNAFTIELDTSNSYITKVNVTRIAGYGQWELEFNSRGSYSIQVSGLSSLGLSQRFYQRDTESHFGFSKIEGNPTIGQTLILLVSASGNYFEVELNKFNVLTSNGSIHQQFNLTNLSEKSYGSIFRPTLDVFQIELTGVDSGGNQVRRIGGTGVQLSDVDLRLGEGSKHYNTLYPGNSSNVNLVLKNLGYPSTFQISITHDNINATFSYSVDNTLVRLKQNETYEIPIVVTASVNASNGDSAKFIVTASTISATGDRSNYASFHYIASTLPPPEFIINQTAAAVKVTSNLLLMLVLIILVSFIDMLNLQVF